MTNNILFYLLVLSVVYIVFGVITISVTLYSRKEQIRVELLRASTSEKLVFLTSAFISGVVLWPLIIFKKD